jgi:hypothetical protein
VKRVTPDQLAARARYHRCTRCGEQLARRDRGTIIYDGSHRAVGKYLTSHYPQWCEICVSEQIWAPPPIHTRAELLALISLIESTEDN